MIGEEALALAQIKTLPPFKAVQEISPFNPLRTSSPPVSISSGDRHGLQAAGIPIQSSSSKSCSTPLHPAPTQRIRDPHQPSNQDRKYHPEQWAYGRLSIGILLYQAHRSCRSQPSIPHGRRHRQSASGLTPAAEQRRTEQMAPPIFSSTWPSRLVHVEFNCIRYTEAAC